MDRKPRNISIDTLFTLFKLQINKLEEENRGKNKPVGEFLKLNSHKNFKSVSFSRYLDSTLSKLSNGTKNGQKGARMKKL